MNISHKVVPMSKGFAIREDKVLHNGKTQVKFISEGNTIKYFKNQFTAEQFLIELKNKQNHAKPPNKIIDFQEQKNLRNNLSSTNNNLQTPDPALIIQNLPDNNPDNNLETKNQTPHLEIKKVQNLIEKQAENITQIVKNIVDNAANNNNKKKLLTLSKKACN